MSINAIKRRFVIGKYFLSIVSYILKNTPPPPQESRANFNLVFSSIPYIVLVNYIRISNIIFVTFYKIINSHNLTFKSYYLSKLLSVVYKSINYTLKNFKLSSKNEKLANLNANIVILYSLPIGKSKIFSTLINHIKI